MKKLILLGLLLVSALYADKYENTVDVEQPGGIEEYVKQCTKALDERQHYACVITGLALAKEYRQPNLIKKYTLVLNDLNLNKGVDVVADTFFMFKEQYNYMFDPSQDQETIDHLCHLGASAYIDYLSQLYKKNFSRPDIGDWAIGVCEGERPPFDPAIDNPE